MPESAANGPKERLQNQSPYEMQEEQMHWEVKGMFEKVLGCCEAHY
jgi:hypothetical protein